MGSDVYLGAGEKTPLWAPGSMIPKLGLMRLIGHRAARTLLATGEIAALPSLLLSTDSCQAQVGCDLLRTRLWAEYLKMVRG